MNKLINKTIIVSAILLSLLIWGHLEKHAYYEIDGSNERFPKFNNNHSEIFLSIKPVNNTITAEVNFIHTKSDIEIDTFGVFINYKKYILTSDTFSFNKKIEKGTAMRTLARTFDSKDFPPDKFFMSLFLQFHENGQPHEIKIDKPIVKRSEYSLVSWDMHDPTIMLIPLLKYVLIISVIGKIGIYLAGKIRLRSKH
jgi:hypothetical protein